MNNNTCTAQDILFLNETKEYTLTATCLLNHLLTHPKLGGQSVKLWQFLFNKARFNKSLAITISYSDLAKALQKSTRTIMRYVQNLLDEGFLCLEQNYYVKKGQGANTFKIRAPKSLIDEALKEKNRTSHKITEISEPLGEDSQQEISQSDDNNVTPPSDTFVTQKNNIKKLINTNNNVVVPLSFSTTDTESSIKTDTPEETNQEAQEQLLVLEKLKAQQKLLESSWVNEKDVKRKFEANRQYGEITSAIELAQIRLKTFKKAEELNKHEKLKQNALRENAREILKKGGQRLVSELSHQRLIKSLQQMGYRDGNLNQLANEVIHEVRFGSLVKKQDSITENSVERAINIGLKLIREERWQTPTSLCIQTKSSFNKHAALV